MKTDVDGYSTYSSVRKVDLNQSAQLTIYPNPCTNYVTISSTTEEKMNVMLLNNNGQRIMMPINLEGNKATLNVSAAPVGIYFIHILQGSQDEIKTISIIK